MILLCCEYYALHAQNTFKQILNSDQNLMRERKQKQKTLFIPAFPALLWTLKVRQSHQKWDKKTPRRQSSKELY